MRANSLTDLLWWCNFILRIASWIVPSKCRNDWRKEWESEVWHWWHFLVESGQLSVRTEQELIKHCWGAFADAVWHRFNRSEVMWLVNEVPRRPGMCVVGLTVLLLGSLVVCRPGKFYRAMFVQPLNPASSRTLTVALDQTYAWVEPLRLQAAAESWSEGSREIEAKATYEWRPSVVLGPRGKETILSARMTPNLFELLGVQITPPGRGIGSPDLSLGKKWTQVAHRITNSLRRSYPTLGP
jgi:hypothetical protein